MAHIHIFHRSLRLNDNTSLIAQIKELTKAITPIFILLQNKLNQKITNILQMVPFNL